MKQGVTQKLQAFPEVSQWHLKALPLAPSPVSLQLLTRMPHVFGMSSVMPVLRSPLLSHFPSLGTL